MEEVKILAGKTLKDATARELIETLQNNLQTANETIGTLTTNLQTANETIGSLQGELSNANTRIGDLQTNLQTTNNLLETANGKITDLETENDELNSNKISFIDTDNVIVPKTTTTHSDVFTYTASEDCVLCILMVATNQTTTTGQDYYINDKWIGRNDWAGSSGGGYYSRYFMLKKGQTFKLDKGATSYAVYGLIK